MLKIRNTYSFLLCLLVSMPMLWAQEQVEYREKKVSGEERIRFFFRINSHDFDGDFSSNRAELTKLDSIMSADHALVGLDSLELIATASIDGKEQNNASLSERRAKTMKSVLTQRYPQIDGDLLTAVSIPENWADLRASIVEDNNMPYRNEALDIIDSDRTADVKEWLLKKLRGGVAWKYLKDHILPNQRYGASMVFFYNIHRERLIREKIKPVIDTVYKEPFIIRDTVVLRDTVYILNEKARPIALKTNLLYDVVGAVNAEIEIPIGKRWSIGAEIMYPWWYNNKSNFTERIRMGSLSVTYWLGDREKWDYLTGWNIGLMGGYGDYDIQPWQEKGWQGSIINTALNIGYAHNISKNGRWHMHYQVGVGMMQTDYKQYYKMWDTKFGDVKVFEYPWETKRYRWFGPTQLEVSLVYMINFGKKR